MKPDIKTANARMMILLSVDVVKRVEQKQPAIRQILRMDELIAGNVKDLKRLRTPERRALRQMKIM